ncbi:hypothetical protein SCARD494_14126 [Seiridium cardinale]
MRTQACEPCAKRKVRCDREEPCSNCKRRKQDRCSYAELPPVDRIRKLEDLVRSLGGSPEDADAPRIRARSTGSSPAAAANLSPHGRQGLASSSDKSSKDPVILEEDGQQYYIESRAWLVHGHRESGNRPGGSTNPLLLRNAPSAFQSIICSRQPPNLTAARHFGDNTKTLWSIYKQRVDPFVKTTFSWDLERLEASVTSSPQSSRLDDAEDALISSIYLGSVTSLTDAECREKFNRSKSSLVSECQALCEEALARTNILCMKNIIALKAMAVYLFVGLDCLSTQSLWTLMGLAIRNGEKLGIQRDGTLLGLSPLQTEERRRLWWLLQYLDLIFAIKLGATPSTLTIEWDVKLPLNIEDEDLRTDIASFPEERKGLTSMSYCLFTYYILSEQRRYHADKGRFELSWSTNQSVPTEVKKTFIDYLEHGLNKNFMQYCDPIKPLDVLIQLMSRALTCVFRQRILLSIGGQPGHVQQEHRGPLLALSMQLMEYAIAMHSHRLLKDFQWLTTNGFPWPAFMVVLVEASNETDTDKCQHIWDVLSDLYASNKSFLELTEDRRRLHAAELIVAAWKTCQSRGTLGRTLPRPDFVSNLEKQLVESVAASTQTSAPKDTDANLPGEPAVLDTYPSFLDDQDGNGLLELNFQDIDWSFWNSFD